MILETNWQYIVTELFALEINKPETALLSDKPIIYTKMYRLDPNFLVLNIVLSFSSIYRTGKWYYANQDMQLLNFK
jgi:hypothetical protein